ncbi:MAG: SpoIIE family protein phosphatase [Candidatus Delongbacteria bacterium]|nr:SpoIIE family protein phosphatase [Candidatus Delongbacteria bacterium]MBN2834309.1 SpoIIE family protein phosphatase [Candidatus Delongbacteria bacterium]
MDLLKVLVVDDEIISCKLIKKLLVSLNFETMFITSSDLVENTIESYRPNLILLDLIIPGRNGYDTLQDLQKHDLYKKIPVIMLSGESSEIAIAECLEAGAVDYLTKPVGKLELGARIKSVVRLFELNKAIEQKNHKLIETYKIIENELNIAKKIQQSIIGPEEFLNSVVKCSTKLTIANRLGGDYFDIIETGDGEIAGTVVDVSGHGVSSALIVMMIKTFLDSFIRVIKSPSDLMSKLHSHLYGKIPKGHYAAMNLFRIDKNLKLSFSSAGLYDLVILRKEFEDLEFIECRNFSVAFIPKINFTEKNVQLCSGDKIIIHTDGIHESLNSKSEMMGLDRFYKIIKNNADLSTSEIVEKLFDERDRFSEGIDSVDDCTVMVLEIR